MPIKIPFFEKKEEAKKTPVAGEVSAPHNESLPNIKEEVGYPSEAHEEPESAEDAHYEDLEEAPEGDIAGNEGMPPEGSTEYFRDEGVPGEEMPQEEIPEEGEAEAQELPPFLPPPPLGPESAEAEGFSGESTGEDVEEIIKDAVNGLRNELEGKIKKLERDVEDVRRLEKKIDNISENFEKLKDKYDELKEKISSLPAQSQEDLKAIKATVNTMNQIMSSALPALIKEVREIKGQK